ncbi:MAG: beta-ketoacyl-ACP synthase II [Candidatus Melainabacteria bacterium]|nr:beta-ketoacyl-ACP synthase II [Candidatus Melainabacteria bacterium]
MKKKVVITGMGLICSLGESKEELWNNLIGGKSGISKMDFFPEVKTSKDICRVGAVCNDFKPELYLDLKVIRRTDRFIQLALSASINAIKDANFDMVNYPHPERIGVVVGSAAGGILTIIEQHNILKAKGPTKVSPFTIPSMIANMPAGYISIYHSAKGPVTCTVTACATSTNCIGDAFKIIQTGNADVVFAGGCEAPLTGVSVAAFGAARTLSTSFNDEPEKSSRPFDKDRDGFVMGEGAGILILEEMEHAKARGAKIYCELAGFGATSDASDIVSPSPDGDGAARAIKLAIEDANSSPEEIDYINAHATSTIVGDIVEVVAIKRVFGNRAKKGLLPVSSTKSMHGHLLGATGAIEAIACVMALQTNIIPPTTNIDNPDPQCDLDFVPHKARKVNDLNLVISNSFGFGGHNACLVFRRI